MQMVMSMFRSPQKDAFLSAALREERKDELKNPAISRQICQSGGLQRLQACSREDDQETVGALVIYTLQFLGLALQKIPQARQFNNMFRRQNRAD